jgi:zinc transporter 2
MAFVLGHDHGHGHGHGHGHDHHHGRSHAISVSTNRYVKHTNDEHHHTDGDHTHHHDEEKHSKDKHHHTHEDHVQSHNHDVHREVTVPLLGESKAIPEKTKKQNINVHGAYLHVLGDSIQSVGVMIGGAIIWYKPEWKIVDLICTLIFSVIVLFTTINMLRNILEVLMESTPREIDSTRLQKGLLEMEEVVAVHELHIWAITVGKVLLACHVKINPEADADMMLDKVIDYIKSVHSISHVTIQIEC